MLSLLRRCCICPRWWKRDASTQTMASEPQPEAVIDIPVDEEIVTVQKFQSPPLPVSDGDDDFEHVA
jgi:hypothetical protein